MRHPNRDQGDRTKEQVNQTAARPEARPLAGPHPPEYVIVLWAGEQLRAQIQRNNAAIAAELQDRSKRQHGRKAEPSSELEAEP
jgi:hypothetical protein